jgi:hypothetical protein
MQFFSKLDFNFSDFELKEEHFGELSFSEMSTIDSTILNPKEKTDFYELCEFHKSDQLSLLYRATRDGFESSQFHKHCDNFPNTLTIIKSSTGSIFGGFTSQMWDSLENCYKIDDKAFLFSFRNHENRKQKIPVANPNQAIFNSAAFGPTFGNGYDIFIANMANTNRLSFSILGNSYKIDCQNPRSFLAGAQHFHVSEIEVFAYRKHDEPGIDLSDLRL